VAGASQSETGNRWDSRYAGSDYFFGTEPNGFLASVVEHLPAGRALFIADGEGRNSVFLAQKGWECVSMDASREGNRKAEELAGRSGVSLSTVHGDLSEYQMGDEAWDVIVSIFCHLPPELRRSVHNRVVRALRPGGALVLEAYTPEQLQYGTGGPPREELMMTKELLRKDFAGLRLERCSEVVREVQEGCGHTGQAAVVQVLGFKSKPSG
jgi:cyclopropane fatty-acyl-phospholipid synthase-like methyltransferase